MTPPIEVKSYFEPTSNLLRTGETTRTNEVTEVKRSNKLLRNSRSYRALIVIITNIIDYYYNRSKRSNILYYLLLLVIGGSIAGILDMCSVYISIPTSFTSFVTFPEIYTMVLNSITTHTGAIT